MATYSFRLVVADRIDDEAADRLFEAGGVDGFPESGPQGHSIGFDRESDSLESAVSSAVEQVRSAGLGILGVELAG